MKRKEYKPKLVVYKSSADCDDFILSRLMTVFSSSYAASLLLPTGQTPLGVYKLLKSKIINKNIKLNKVVIFNLDEYYPISRNSPDSYYRYMKRNILDQINFDMKRWFIADGEADKIDGEISRLKNAYKKYGPADLALLGIGPGTTCHVGFNERGSSIDSKIRYVRLDPETAQVNSKLFTNASDIPKGAITFGISEILQSKEIILYAKGKEKAWGIKRSLEGPVSSDAPASFLRYHPNVTIVLDKDAGGILTTFL
jgi:glucosamine-6-phosphate deaminase